MRKKSEGLTVEKLTELQEYAESGQFEQDHMVVLPKDKDGEVIHLDDMTPEQAKMLGLD